MKGRGSHDIRQDNKGVVILRWFDNKSVTLASSFVGVGEQTLVTKLDKLSKSYFQI